MTENLQAYGAGPRETLEARVGREIAGAVPYTHGRYVRPAELRLLLQGRTDNVCLGVTMLDLAGRGHLRIGQTPSTETSAPSLTVQALPSQFGDALRFEAATMFALVPDRRGEDGGPAIPVDDLARNLRVGPAAIRYALEAEATDTMAWFRTMPARRRRTRRLFSAIALALGVMFLLPASLYGYQGVALVLLSALAAAGLSFPWRPGYAPAGHKAVVAALSFREFLIEAPSRLRTRLADDEVLAFLVPFAAAVDCLDLWAAEPASNRPAGAGRVFDSQSALTASDVYRLAARFVDDVAGQMRLAERTRNFKEPLIFIRDQGLGDAWSGLWH